MSVKSVVKNCFNFLGFELSNLKAFDKSVQLQVRSNNEIAMLKVKLDKLAYKSWSCTFANEQQLEILGLKSESSPIVIKSNGQLAQDLLVRDLLKGKRNGFFVEFGATNGVSLSNTYLLEKEYNWNGILAEPGRVWLSHLKQSRSAAIDNRCVWSITGSQLIFDETNEPELSTIAQFSSSDFHAEKRKDKSTYYVETVSLIDLLNEYNAPFEIDYLSIDTEGSEFEILKAFDFSKYQFKVITVEHNYAPNREKILALLTSHGYQRIFETLSLFDDWYIHNSVISLL